MHNSRLAGFIIDCQGEDPHAAAAFWSDDVEAEVRRLEALGARRIRQVQSWWVMEAPTGQRFCVVQWVGDKP